MDFPGFIDRVIIYKVIQRTCTDVVELLVEALNYFDAFIDARVEAWNLYIIRMLRQCIRLMSRYTPSALDLDYNAGNLHKVLQLLKRITGGKASKRSLRRNDAVAITS